MLDSNNRFDDLDRLKILAYGVGHFINDLVAACWFNYLLYYLKRVVQTDAAVAALLSGQFCDGVATPIVGYVSDKYRTKWGQRTPWYIFGLIFVFICYIPIYQGYKSDNVSNEYAYYILFPGLFNVGWAALQISHMSLVPSLTCSRKRRVIIN
jgi:Na+/melibiose symporter-like transporter